MRKSFILEWNSHAKVSPMDWRVEIFSYREKSSKGQKAEEFSTFTNK